MKVLIDLQSLQTGSAERGIGRYSAGLAEALIEALAGCEVLILLNDGERKGPQPPALAEILGRVGPEAVIRFPLPAIATPALYPDHDEVRLSRILRERFIEAVRPDVVLVTSLFEFDALSTIPPASARAYFCAAILYDLIPLADPAHHLGSRRLLDWYHEGLDQLRHADAVLSISAHVRRDALARLGLPAARVKNIAAGTRLDRVARDPGSMQSANSWSAIGPYLLYVGGFDKRKNVDKLVACYARLPAASRSRHRLVLAGSLSPAQCAELQQQAASLGLGKGELVFTGRVDDGLLVELYSKAALFVFPSADEGFGLPPLEAMSFGIPVLASNRASLPEVVGNPAALFDPDDPQAFLAKLQRGLHDPDYRADLVRQGLQQAALFSWKGSARAALDFIAERRALFLAGQPPHYPSFHDFLARTCAEQGLRLEEEGIADLKNLLARGLREAARLKDARKEPLPPEFAVTSVFAAVVPDHSGVEAPRVFASTLCRQQHFHLPLYAYWCRMLGEQPRLHRKQWEWVYICQVLHERGFLSGERSAIGFGVGREPLVSFFASRGVRVLASDLDVCAAQRAGWTSTRQHGDSLETLNERGLCSEQAFRRQVSLRTVDMNALPADLGLHDFCWSSCAFEHLGSLRKGLDFVRNSARLLKPGGIAVHTTEYNLGSNARTLDHNPGLVLFRRRDIEQLVEELAAEGYRTEAVDFSAGMDELERHVDLPPHLGEPHLRLQLAGEFLTTSLGLVIHAPQG